jgi:hypothetical protein
MLNRSLYSLYLANGFTHQQIVSWYSEQLNQELEIDPDDLSVWSLTHNCWLPQSAINRASDGVEYSRQCHDFAQTEMPD